MFEKEKLILALKRALWTALQTMIAMVPVGARIQEVDWLDILSVCAVAAILSFAKSIVIGMPEAATEGTMYIDTTDEDTDRYLIDLDQLEGLSEKKTIRLNVRTDKKLDGDVKYIGE